MPKTEGTHRYLSAREVADILGTDIRTVQRHAAAGDLPTAGRLGKAYIFDADTIAAIEAGSWHDRRRIEATR